MEYYLTSESVAPGHPDKICDQISDALVDAYLSKDPLSHTAIETFATLGQVIIGGETWGPVLSLPDVEAIVRNVVKDIGYEQEDFHWKTFNFLNLLHGQSADLRHGLGINHGAGDQGIMVGFACDETDVLLPAPLYYAHRIMENIQKWRLLNPSSGLGLDGKCQVTVRYENGVPSGAHAIVLSLQHHQESDLKALREKVWTIVESSLPPGWMCTDENFYFNPMGRFVIGGPAADCGLTGRKIMVDTYGGSAPHGGGSFSGKDPTKVDRTAAYMLRHIAKNIVAAGLAKRCTIPSVGQTLSRFM
jgi:S-adenosylmethionine synthetase